MRMNANRAAISVFVIMTCGLSLASAQTASMRRSNADMGFICATAWVVTEPTVMATARTRPISTRSRAILWRPLLSADRHRRERCLWILTLYMF